jgi:putative ABC transport system substrate-binding protein
MRRREFLLLTAAAAATLLPHASRAQQASRVPRIAVLSTELTATNRQAFLQGLARYGYVDGANITLEFFAAPTIDDMPGMATRAVASKPQIIVTNGLAAALAAKNATSTIPIILAGSPYVVASGLVTNLAKPGGNVTGLTTEGYEEDAKKVAIIKEIVPGLTRLAVMVLPADPAHRFYLAEVKRAAQVLGIETMVLEAREGADFEPLFIQAAEQRADAIYIIASGPLNVERKRLSEFALKYRFPAIGNQNYARDGLLVGYNINGYALNLVNAMARAGYYVDLILKGAKPGDIPLEQPTNVDMVVNLKTAKALGVTIPFGVLVQANEVIQ